MSDALIIFGLLALLLLIAGVFSYYLRDNGNDDPGDIEHFDHEHSDPYTP
jgi:hypothetical protein